VNQGQGQGQGQDHSLRVTLRRKRLCMYTLQ